jgi:MFS family permease
MENRVAIADDEEITFVAIRETETTSLLNGGQLVAEESTKAPRHRVVTFILTTFFISQLAFALLEPGYIAALELGICHEAYTNSDVSNCIDQDCKSPEIQGRLATLTGWQGTMACIPSLIVTVPYGMLSDRWGCNRVLLLAFVGSVLNATFSLSVCKYSHPSYNYSSLVFVLTQHLSIF